MPKKQPRNSFYYYMLHFKEEQRKKGINYGNMQEVSLAAGSAWPQEPPAVKAKFEAIAKEEKMKNQIPEKKFTTTGIPLSEIEQQEKERRDAEEAERKDINNFVKLKSFNGSILREDIYLMDVNYFCKCNGEYLIGESTVIRFTLEDGIKDSYHEIINPGGIPMGFALDVKLGSEQYGLPMPDEATKRTNYMKVLANLIDYLKGDSTSKTLPPIFTMPDKVACVSDFIHQMCRRAAEDESLFRVYKLDMLFFTLINAIKTRSDEGYPKESLALIQLKKDPFKFVPGLGCEMHEQGDKGIECTSSRSQRWTYTILDCCCPIVGVEPIPGRHLPYNLDVEGVLAYREQRRERAAASVAAPSVIGPASVHGSEQLNDSSYSVASASSTKRVEPPLRLPKTDYSKSIRPVPAPGLTEEDFPALSASAGRGRGRTLSDSFGKINLKK